MHTSPWTPENTEVAFEMARNGFSASKIGIRLGVSRNAVIGKLHRSGMFTKDLSKKVRTGPTKKERAQARRIEREAIAKFKKLREEEVKPQIFPSVPPKDFHPQAVTILDLEFWHCRWPVGGHGEHTLFCGEQKKSAAHSYCKHHEVMKARGRE